MCFEDPLVGEVILVDIGYYLVCKSGRGLYILVVVVEYRVYDGRFSCGGVPYDIGDRVRVGVEDGVHV